jgi:hypothetical protein
MEQAYRHWWMVSFALGCIHLPIRGFAWAKVAKQAEDHLKREVDLKNFDEVERKRWVEAVEIGKESDLMAEMFFRRFPKRDKQPLKKRKDVDANPWNSGVLKQMIRVIQDE